MYIVIGVICFSTNFIVSMEAKGIELSQERADRFACQLRQEYKEINKVIQKKEGRVFKEKLFSAKYPSLLEQRNNILHSLEENIYTDYEVIMKNVITKEERLTYKSITQIYGHWRRYEESLGDYLLLCDFNNMSEEETKKKSTKLYKFN